MAWMRWKATWGVVAAALSLASCDCSAIGTSQTGLEIVTLEVESTDPPADPRGGELVVVPGAEVTLAWSLQEEAEEVILAANDLVIARWAGSQAPSGFVDACSPTRCTTERPGQVVYTLTAIFSKEDEVVDSRSVRITVSPSGLQILAFRLHPSRLPATGGVSLSWETAGAVGVEIAALPAKGGPERTLASLGLPQARLGETDDQAQGPTRYELRARSPDGAVVTASATVTFDDDAFFTELRADPLRVHPGTTATISWKSVGLERLSILRDDGGAPLLGISGAEAGEGSREVTIQGPVRFLLVGTSTEGESVDEVCDGTGCREASVSVGLLPRAKLLRFYADPPSIAWGDSTTLRFEGTDADELRLSWMDDGLPQVRTLGPGERELAVAPAGNTSYTLQALSRGVVASTATALVQVTAKARLFVERDPTTGGAYANEPLRISWQTLGADRVQLDVGGAPADLSGLDVGEDGVVVFVPDLEEGARLPIVLSAFRNLMVSTATEEVLVFRRTNGLAAAFAPAAIARGSLSTLEWAASGVAEVWSAPPLPAPGTGAAPLPDASWSELPWETAEVELPFSWPSPRGFDGVTIHRDGALVLGAGVLPPPGARMPAQRGGAVILPYRASLAADGQSRVRWKEEPGSLAVEWSDLVLEGERVGFWARLLAGGDVEVGWKRLPSAADGGRTELSVDPGWPGLASLPLSWAGTAKEGASVRFLAGPMEAAGNRVVFPEESFAPFLQGWDPAGGVVSTGRPRLEVR